LGRTQGGARRCRLTGEAHSAEDAMSNTPHDLTEEFPDRRERITELKTKDGHFARLVEEYNEVNRAIHRIETRVEPTSEDVEEELKRQRVRLKDEIYQMLEGGEKTDAAASPLGADPANAPRLRSTGNT
jgi:uncharacterized protein YdcH (DUF465 family)